MLNSMGPEIPDLKNVSAPKSKSSYLSPRQKELSKGIFFIKAKILPASFTWF